MAYNVKIAEFEGPFQLLLNLVSRQRIDVGTISVSTIADQYLAEVDNMRELDMDVASDFLTVAATLLALKAAALLPSEEVVYDDEFDDLTPDEARDMLVARLFAYKQFKNAAFALSSRLQNEGRMHPRQAGLESDFVGLLPDYLDGVTLHSLAVICADLAARREVFLLEAEHIAARPISLETHIDDLVKRLARKKKLSFNQIIDGDRTPAIIVVNFLALLELYHRGMVDLTQAEEYGDITVLYRKEEEWTPAPPLDDEESEPEPEETDNND